MTLTQTDYSYRRQVEPILHRGVPAGLVHHMSLYGCYHDVDLRAINTPTECYKYMSPVLQRCNAVFAGWAIGGNVRILDNYCMDNRRLLLKSTQPYGSHYKWTLCHGFYELSVIDYSCEIFFFGYETVFFSGMSPLVPP